MKPKIILTCEHGDKEVPRRLAKTFKVPKSELLSHKSWDYGVKSMTLKLSKARNVTSHINSTTRLLIDMNRELEQYKSKHKYLLSTGLKKEELVVPEKLYLKYRRDIEALVKECIQKKEPFYIFSMHSFTSVMNGKKRQTDIGILFRKDREKEARTAQALKSHLKSSTRLKNLSVHFNRPYRGHTDCFLNDLLDKYGKNKYCLGGCFLEFNASLLKRSPEKVTHEIKSFFEDLA
ncbi:MAG: N-formylglutamate amidohydrolase [Bdellovibrionales bacterium]